MKVILVRSRTTDPAVNKLADTLAKKGHDVTLLLWDRHNTLRKDDSRNYEVHCLSLRAPQDEVLVAAFLPFWWVYEFFFLVFNRSDVIHACDLDTLLPAILVKAFRKVKLNYTIFDFYAGNLPEESFLNMLVGRVLSSAEKIAIGSTEILFLVDEARFEQVRGARIRRIAYIYNTPLDVNPIPNRLKDEIRGDFVIFYAGVLVKSRGLHHIVKAVNDLEGVRLDIAGSGPEREYIKSASANRGAKICYIGQIPYDKVIEFTVGSDLLIAMYEPSTPNSRYASPNKLFEAMMCGKPIIVSDGSSMAEIVRREMCGIVVQYGDVEGIRGAIEMLKNDQALREELGRNGRMAYESKYSWDVMEKRLIAAYEQEVD